ncbi:hypothetical protein E2C01_034459 [Portunus trituberculatus]|uniref:Uncharacterized protein n=1 Tax=Portunus trituberculatus TaxID=210409 RepID=A0A5B7F5R6_PORTR|nr:hypothetical protein [Portunus trituberculatus]
MQERKLNKVNKTFTILTASVLGHIFTLRFVYD